MQFSKQPQEGRKQRIELLDSAELPVTALLDQQAGPYRRSQVAVDDLLDAAVLFACRCSNRFLYWRIRLSMNLEFTRT